MLASGSGRRDHLTYRGNLRATRHGWLRLTPAYSVHLVGAILDEVGPGAARVLDPFCGTGTTALLCAERGLAADTLDINPFLVWLARAKTRRYAASHLRALETARQSVGRALRAGRGATWTPPLRDIERWWAPGALAALGRGMVRLRALSPELPVAALDLARVAFCRTLIDCARVSFGHQSMSFGQALPETDRDGAERVAAAWQAAVARVVEGAEAPIARLPRAMHGDARRLDRIVEPARYSCVITSPPYPNRMSYIRELRPYMFWLGYLSDAAQAGELDWQAIGGTWGRATSYVARWRPEQDLTVPHPGFRELIGRIAQTSVVLSRYVEKYFHDMNEHVRGLFRAVAPGGSVHYIVGNSKFYDVVVPVEDIYACLLTAAGFRDVSVRTVRKRTSKKELYEYVVMGRRPRG